MRLPATSARNSVGKRRRYATRNVAKRLRYNGLQITNECYPVVQHILKYDD